VPEKIAQSLACILLWIICRRMAVFAWKCAAETAVNRWIKMLLEQDFVRAVSPYWRVKKLSSLKQVRPWREGRLRWLGLPVTYHHGLTAHRWSPIQVPTRQITAGNWTCNLLITVWRPNHYATTPSGRQHLSYKSNITINTQFLINFVCHIHWSHTVFI